MFQSMEEEPEHRLIGYARVSTDDQDLSLQKRALTDFGIKPEHIFEEYASGGTMKRPELHKALRSMREGDTFVVWKLDRLGRTLTGVIETVEMIQAEGVEFVSLTEKIDTTGAMGRAFFRIALTFAELERELISERTKAGMAVAKMRGAQFGQPHAVTKTKKRRDEARKIIEEGLENISAAEAIDRINKADPKAKPIKTPTTWGRWLAAKCPGLEKP